MSIWKFREIRKAVEFEELLTLDEGNTSVETFGMENVKVFVKREDQNPTGSWKDRGTAFKISKLKSEGIKHAVISSSGNAAISYLRYSMLYPELKLDVIVSDKNINSVKLEKIQELLERTKHELHKTDKAKKLRAQIVGQQGAYNLSATLDNEIVKGYWSLGIELAQLIKKNIGSQNKSTGLFVPVSSGTALIGIVQGLTFELKDEFSLPRIFVCQTSKVHPVVDQVSENIVSEKFNKADSIVDKSCLRSPQILNILKQTNGSAYAITNDELENAKQEADKYNIVDLSFTSLLSIAGVLRAVDEGEELENAICIASGL